MEHTTKNDNKAISPAEKILCYARDSILVNMRFLDTALSVLMWKPEAAVPGVACDGIKVSYDPIYILKEYKKEPASVMRLYLHLLFHMIFNHSFRYDRVDKKLWDLAADMAVENVILELLIPGAELKEDEERKRKLRFYDSEVSALTGDKLYRYFKNGMTGEAEIQELSSLFYMDSHSFWERREELFITIEQWKKISGRVQADLRSFSKNKNTSESLSENLTEAVKERHDYKKLLHRFMVMGEEQQVNEDEFDYIYYTYGLSVYGNMPLVEPLEYKDSKKVKEFVIAIDTSASCRGGVVQGFLRKTYALLTGEENFFNKMNVHIIQCDSEVRKDTKITDREDFERFLNKESLSGFGSTDFRPVFDYVEELKAGHEFENLKGLIYFTDGYGTYPVKMPPYDVMFVFPDTGGEGPEVPPWAVKVLLEEDEQHEYQTGK